MAVRIDEDIRGLEIAMYNICGVEILHRLADLMHDEAVVNIFEYLLADGVVQVGLHELENQIEIFVVVRTHHVQQLDYVGVTQVVQVTDLAVRPLGVD